MKISVIMVCYNSHSSIEQAIWSVVNQRCQNYEFIVIDGGSTDGTVEIIQKYQEYIRMIVSEADQGIYDAMNKGIDLAHGDYIYFLGADDAITDEDVLSIVSEYLSKNSTVDILCGKVWGIDETAGSQQRLMGDRLSVERIFQGGMPPHQGMFVKTDYLRTNYFDIKYSIAADYDMFLKLVLKSVQISYIDLPIAFYSLSGTSSENINCFTQYLDIMKSNNVEEKYQQGFLKNKFAIYKRNCRIKKWMRAFQLMYVVQRLRGYHTHICKNPYCRWCK